MECALERNIRFFSHAGSTSRLAIDRSRVGLAEELTDQKLTELTYQSLLYHQSSVITNM